MSSPFVHRVSLTMFIGLLAVGTTHAGPITIGDPSFEGVVISTPGNFTSGIYANGSWNSGTTAGIFRPSASSYSSVPDGVNVGYSSSATVIDQTLTASLTANTTYTLNVNVGSRLDSPHNDGYTLQLLAGGVVLAGTTNFPVPTDGSFVLATDSYTAGAGDPHLGQPLEIKLISAPTGQTSFDNVTLNSAPVPEPASLALLIEAAAAVVVVLSWRKRNRTSKQR